jgi:hypothetical protein
MIANSIGKAILTAIKQNWTPLHSTKKTVTLFFSDAAHKDLLNKEKREDKKEYRFV